MKIAIVGAGISGLAAARTLTRNGHEVALFDKGANVGGRVGTRRMEHNGATTLFDHGAQNVKSHGTSLETELHRIAFDSRVFISAPTCLRDEATVLAPDETINAEAKWSCVGGMRNLPQALAQGLNVRTNIRVARLEENRDGVTLFDDEDRVLDVCQAAIITIPTPQAADLLGCSALSGNIAARIEKLRGVQYSRCLSVLLLFDGKTNLDFYALLAQNRQNPLLWLAHENAKSGFVAQDQTALIAQLGDEISCELWDETDEEIVRQTLAWLQRIDRRFAMSQASFVKRWKFSQPKNPLTFEDANSPQDRVLVCGDGLSKGRVTAAWDSGVQAAQFFL